MYARFIRLNAVLHIVLQNRAPVADGKLLFFDVIAVRDVIDGIPFHPVIGLLVEIFQKVDVKDKYEDIVCLHGGAQPVQLLFDPEIAFALRDPVDLLLPRLSGAVAVHRVRVPGKLLFGKIALRRAGDLIGHFIILPCDGFPVGGNPCRRRSRHDAHAHDAQAENELEGQAEPVILFLRLFLRIHSFLLPDEISFHFFQTGSGTAPAACRGFPCPPVIPSSS